MIVKSKDDVRQEQFATQLITLFAQVRFDLPPFVVCVRVNVCVCCVCVVCVCCVLCVWCV